MKTAPGKGYQMEQKVGNGPVAGAELDGCLQQEGQVWILRMVSTHKVTQTALITVKFHSVLGENRQYPAGGFGTGLTHSSGQLLPG